MEMRHLLRLPVEILVWIYRSLDDIDDALHLARSCKYLNSVFNLTNVRVEIFRSIINNAPHHENDVALSLIVGMRELFSREFYSESPVPTRLSDRKRFITKHLVSMDDVLDNNYYTNYLPPEMVWEIVCRWHAMRLLFDLYCDSVVRAAYTHSAFPYMPWREGDEVSEELLAGEDPLPSPSRRNCETVDRLNPRQKRQSYKRFYRALTAHWFLVEILWFARVKTYKNPKNCEQMIYRVWSLWTDNPRRPLQEKMDVIEVGDFVWCFLGRKIFDVSSVSTWVEGENPRMRQLYLDPGRTAQENWNHFISSVTSYLRPPHIIELLLLVAWDRCGRPQIDRLAYLRHLGFCDTRDGVFVHGTSLDLTVEIRYFPVSIVAADVENEFLRAQGCEPDAIYVPHDSEEEEPEIVARWKHYRRVIWPQDARAQLLFRDETPEEIMDRILQS